jgi:hypothetical protein
MSDELKERQLARLAAALREVSEDFEEEVGRRPTCAEFFEVLAEGLRETPDDTLGDVTTANVLALRPTPPCADAAGGEESAVGELNDNVFNLAADLMAETAARLRADSAEAPTLDALCAALTAALRLCPDELFTGARPAEVTAVGAEVEGKKKRGGKKRASRAGDIVAIPAGGGGYYTAVVVAKNIFGTAYGIFEGQTPLEGVSASGRAPLAKPNTLYSGDRFVGKGRWKIVGHDDAALAHFPAEPELYHRPGLPEWLSKGAFGAAQHPKEDKFRDLSKEEAEELGLLSEPGPGSYKGVFQEEAFEQYLDARLKG